MGKSKVNVPFFAEPIEVSDDEKASLERHGLLLDRTPDAPEQPGSKTVTTIYGTRQELPADEARAMEAQGLTAKNKTGAKDAVVPAPDAPAAKESK